MRRKGLHVILCLVLTAMLAVPGCSSKPSGVTDTPLEELGKNHRLRDHVLIGCIIRQGKIIIPRGSDKILVGDTVVLVSGVPGLTDIKDILRK